MYTAEYARTLTDQIASDAITLEMEAIESKIKEAISIGRYFTTFKTKTSDAAVFALEELGYTVNTGDNGSGDEFTFISWDGTEEPPEPESEPEEEPETPEE